MNCIWLVPAMESSPWSRNANSSLWGTAAKKSLLWQWLDLALHPVTHLVLISNLQLVKQTILGLSHFSFSAFLIFHSHPSYSSGRSLVDDLVEVLGPVSDSILKSLPT